MENKTPEIEELGWISIQRKILYSNICPKGKFSRFEAWIYLLLTANHKDALWQGTIIKRGSFITSQLKLSEKFTWSLGQTNKFLYWLKSENRIEIKTTNRYSVITILNYNTYQRNESESENKVKTERKQSENKVKQTIMSNNENNKNNNNKEIVKSTYSSLDTLTTPILEEIAVKYKVPVSFVISKLDDMTNWLGAKGKHYKDYRLALMNWVKTDALKIIQKERQTIRNYKPTEIKI